MMFRASLWTVFTLREKEAPRERSRGPCDGNICSSLFLVEKTLHVTPGPFCSNAANFSLIVLIWVQPGRTSKDRINLSEVRVSGPQSRPPARRRRLERTLRSYG